MKGDIIDNPILLVEDDIVDVMTINRALRQIRAMCPLEVKGNGEEAFKYLRNTIVLPRLILLDLEMPRMNGIEFLTEIQSDEALKSVPVIVLSTSEENRDVRECFNNCVVAYIVKTQSHKELVKNLKMFDMYWTTDDEAVIENQ
jgi:CheY-like chemotaxis protein